MVDQGGRRSIRRAPVRVKRRLQPERMPQSKADKVSPVCNAFRQEVGRRTRKEGDLSSAFGVGVAREGGGKSWPAGRGDAKSQHARISCWQIESTIHPAAALGRRPLWRRTCPRTAVASLRATRTGPKKVNGGGRLAYRAGEGGGPKAEQPNVCQPKLGPKPLPNLNLQERTCGSDACEDRY